MQNYPVLAQHALAKEVRDVSTPVVVLNRHKERLQKIHRFILPQTSSGAETPSLDTEKTIIHPSLNLLF